MKHNLFSKKETLIYGRINKNRFYTPTKAYDISSMPDCNTPYGYIAILRDNIAHLFYQREIFNSYILTEEENVFTLFSVDGKPTIMNKTDAETGVLYTVRVVDEYEEVRIVEIYPLGNIIDEVSGLGVYKAPLMVDPIPGTICSGLLKPKGIHTPLGDGRVKVYQNHPLNSKIKCRLYKVEDGILHFVEICSESTSLKAQIIGEYDTFYSFRNGMVRDIVYKKYCKRVLIVGEVVLLYGKPMQNNYLYSMDRWTEKSYVVSVGDILRCKIKRIHDHGVYVVRHGWEGRVSISDLSMKYKKEWRELIGDKTVLEGVVTRVDAERKRFDLSVKELEMQKYKNVLSEGFDLSVPFEEIKVEEIKEEKPELSIGNVLEKEEQRKKVVCEEDLLMAISANPGMALPIIQYISFILERGGSDDIFNKYINGLEGEERDKLGLAYLNYLLYLGDENNNDKILGLLTLCSKSFAKGVVKRVKGIKDLHFWEKLYSLVGSEQAYECYIDKLLATDLTRGLKSLDSNYQACNVRMIYKFCGEDARARIETMKLGLPGWLEYLKCEEEDVEYTRGLYLRVVSLPWKKNEAKGLFKKWLEWEKSIGGDEETVIKHAREYVKKE
ncbi:30S ribosomal protein S1 [Astathelohania contejeani]|uniref:30S ribosomal protein S1 n=1 Tax=Astathelohania contejeani TaxID=164912 RepID=A0ABQ7I0B6_9MICR|nr:30S ribosomal protein S1 [Thelohania contejeani]